MSILKKEEHPDKAGASLYATQTTQAHNIAESAIHSVGASVEKTIEAFEKICKDFSSITRDAGVTVTRKPEEPPIPSAPSTPTL